MQRPNTNNLIESSESHSPNRIEVTQVETADSTIRINWKKTGKVALAATTLAGGLLLGAKYVEHQVDTVNNSEKATSEYVEVEQGQTLNQIVDEIAPNQNQADVATDVVKANPELRTQDPADPGHIIDPGELIYVPVAENPTGKTGELLPK